MAASCAAVNILLRTEVLQVVVAAVAALGHLASSAPSAAQLSAVIDGLFGLSAHKAEEVQFAVGEALCFVFGGAAAPKWLQAVL